MKSQNSKITDHLTQRNFDIALYSSVYTHEGMLWVPLWNLTGQMVGYQTYYPDALPDERDATLKKYYTCMGRWGNHKHIGIFGVDILDPRKFICFLVEGVFDAAPLHMLGYNCLALLGAGSSPNTSLQQHLMCMPYRFIALCDGDRAGRGLIHYTKEYIILPNRKDIGDYRLEQIQIIVDLLT